jgi:hypothetical protein
MKRHGRQQHTKTGTAGTEFAIAESGLRFLVNLEAYLDTGLFLDHRTLRGMVRERATGRRGAQSVRIHRQLYRVCGRRWRDNERHRGSVEHVRRLGSAQLCTQCA